MKQLFRFSFMLLALLLPATTVANPISLQQAQQNALSFLESKGKSITISSLRHAQLRSGSSTPESYYVFNIGNNDGFVVAAGDDCAPAILGYAESGYIDMDSLPANMKEWLEEYAQQIQFMRDNGYSPSKAPKLTSSYSAISPLLSTTWDQLDPYNQNCPDFFSYGKCVTGCVATAMAQVMYYHRARSVTQTTAQIPAYTCRHRWISGTDTMQIHVDAIPAGSPIDWDNMLDSYGSSATTVQEQAVANLMKYCGASVQMDYANEWNGGSGAYSTDVPTALKAYFNYSSETVLKNRSSYSTNDAWESLIYNELSNSRPVYYSGRNSSAGHAFVCDGYDGSGYYHINWGWSGTSDGYFLLTALDPNEQGTGGSSSGYNQSQAALIYAEPKSSSPSNPVLATSISLNKTSAEINTGGTLQLTATVLPSNATNKTVTWTTSNSSVATVSNNGLVTAKTVGNATITARTTDGSNLSASCFVTVMQTNPITTGEYATLEDGSPAMVGQATLDHLFVRGEYGDLGIMYDNVLSFESGEIQTVWLWLDDDQIYLNEAVQALTPTLVANNAEPYNEITYNSAQFEIYLPQSVQMVELENEDGDMVIYEQGDRMPNSAEFIFSEKGTKVVDGITYRVYTVTITNKNNNGTHFSSRNAKMYRENGGALKKDDAPLVGIFLKNNNQNVHEGRLPDMIIANQEFGFREAFTADPQWEPNDYRFIYGEGGNNETQRFQYYNRVALYGSSGITNVQASSISLNITNKELNKGESFQLTATVLPENTTNKAVNWTSSDPAIATVDTNGLVTAIELGAATITATTTDGSNLSASCALTVTSDLSNYENFLLMEDATAFHGDTIVVPVSLVNEANIISFQTDIFLPVGIELLQEDGDYVIDPSERMTRTHVLVSNDVSNGAVRVLCYSSNYKPFTGESGDDLFYLTVKVADDAEGDYAIQLKNTLLTTSDFEELVAPDVAGTVHVKSYLLGDANNSGSVTVTDVVVTSQYVLEMNPQPFVFEAADVNFDGNITVTDVSRIAWMVLNPTLGAPMRATMLWNNGDYMSGESVIILPGETRKVNIALDNEMDYTAFQFDLKLPEGLSASNFAVTDRAGSHAFDVSMLADGNTRALCYSPTLKGISGHEGALLTFDVTATGLVQGDITVDGIELVTTGCQTVKLDAFAIGVNNSSAINEVANGKTVAHVDYFNLAGQHLTEPVDGVTLIITTYTDGTRIATKVYR